MSAADPQAQPPSAGHSPYPEVVSPDAPLQGTASLQVLSTGYLGGRFASTVTLVRDGAALIVVNPGMVADIESILRPLRDRGVRTAAVTDVVLLTAGPAHIVNAALFPGARLHDATAVYQNDTKARRPADGVLISPSVRLIETPGHHPGDLTVLAATPRGIVALTHLWRSRSDGAEREPDGDPDALRRAKTRVLGVASRIIPAHGAPFRPGPDTSV
jgi:glyoxylase-like metal-dependent hydrolase (beta-lactamase superfamily II)